MIKSHGGVVANVLKCAVHTRADSDDTSLIGARQNETKSRRKSQEMESHKFGSVESRIDLCCVSVWIIDTSQIFGRNVYFKHVAVDKPALHALSLFHSCGAGTGYLVRLCSLQLCHISIK